MGDRYQQFLGSDPGMIVELIDDSVSPYLVRTDDGFEFCISAEDFKDYYRKEGSPTPKRWVHLVTNPDEGSVDSRKMVEVMDIIHSFEDVLQDFDKSRAFVRKALKAIGGGSKADISKARQLVETSGLDVTSLTDKHWDRLVSINDDLRSLLLSDQCAVLQFPDLPEIRGTGDQTEGQVLRQSRPEAKKTPKKIVTKGRMGGMKNVDMEVHGDNLTISVDLSKEFGPSKSGKTIIVASTEGNKTIPGRIEKIGLNVYRQPDKKGSKGRLQSFKNVAMAVEGDGLTITVDLSVELGPSKSGKTIMIASTGGNQLVYGRGEKIGLNVYRKIE
ncbi:MAG: hypothetical protein ACLP5H_09485 [Desulfomonilaceae bacterium]